MVLDAVCKRIVIFFTSIDSSSRRRSLKFSSDIQKAPECAICFKMKTTQKSFIHDGNSSFSCSSVNIGIHASTCSKVVFKVAWILKQNFIAILWQYWWTIFLKKAILAPSHSRHVNTYVYVCVVVIKGDEKKKKLFWNEINTVSKCFLASLLFDANKWFDPYFLSPYWACRHLREQLIKSCQTLITKFSLREYENNNYALWMPLIIKLLQWRVLHRFSLPSRNHFFSFPLANFCHSYPKRQTLLLIVKTWNCDLDKY